MYSKTKTDFQCLLGHGIPWNKFGVYADNEQWCIISTASSSGREIRLGRWFRWTTAWLCSEWKVSGHCVFLWQSDWNRLQVRANALEIRLPKRWIQFTCCYCGKRYDLHWMRSNGICPQPPGWKRALVDKSNQRFSRIRMDDHGHSVGIATGGSVSPPSNCRCPSTRTLRHITLPCSI